MEATIDYQKLAAQLIGQIGAQAGGARHKAVSSTPTTVYGHGGIYGQAGGISSARPANQGVNAGGVAQAGPR